MTMEIAQTSISILMVEPGLLQMLAAYSEESRNRDLPEFSPDWRMYQDMERVGIFRVFGAYKNGRLVGFVSVLMSQMAHYSRKLAIVESFFVDPLHRKFGTAKKLLAAAEDYARAAGSPVLYVTAPKDGRLIRALPAMGYRPTNTLFCRRIDDNISDNGA